jgi:hypothetical protein
MILYCTSPVRQGMVVQSHSDAAGCRRLNSGRCQSNTAAKQQRPSHVSVHHRAPGKVGRVRTWRPIADRGFEAVQDSRLSNLNEILRRTAEAEPGC